MTKKILFLLLLFINRAFCQEKDFENYKESEIEVFGKCFKNLKPIEGTREILPLNKNVKFCSLYQCVSRIGQAENNKDLQDSIFKRATEITILLYNEKTPIYLLSGMGSFGEANERNLNLNDDDNLVYISVAECISSDLLEKIKDKVNKTTTELINNSKSVKTKKE